MASKVSETAPKSAGQGARHAVSRISSYYRVPVKTAYDGQARGVNWGIAYRRIRAGTPRHNSRVQRQHGLDTQRFYKNRRFLSLADARSKLADYNAWSNTRIRVCLYFHSPGPIIAAFYR